MTTFVETIRKSRVRLEWVWLFLASGLLLVANGANTIGLAAWLTPLFLLRFVRQQRLWLGLSIAFVLLAVTFAIQFRGMVPMTGIAYFAFNAMFGLILVIPYLFDRFLTPRLTGLAATLVFPFAWAGMDYLTSFTIGGSWGSIAYSQYGNLPLLQLLSVTGMWGITFLFGWFASIGNLVWEDGIVSVRARQSAAIYGSILIGVILAGGARMAFFPPASETIRVAGLVRNDVDPALRSGIKHVREKKAIAEEVAQFRDWSRSVSEHLLTRAEREAEAGAKIILWGEANIVVFKEDEEALLARGRALAAKHKIYLGMAIVSFHQDKDPAGENKIVLITPEGQVAWEYFKTHPVPGPEAQVSIKGDGKLRSLDTPYGRLSAAICFDFDFPQLLQQAGTLNADIMLNPSSDWIAIDPWHTVMASYRGIEQGFNQVRPTSDGLSAAYDYQGRTLAVLDHFRATNRNMIVQMPTKGVPTLYARLGDWFAWLSLLGLAVLVAITGWSNSQSIHAHPRRH